MAFMQLIMKASRLAKAKKELVEEKTDAIKISKKEPTKKKCRHYAIDLRLQIKRLLKKALSCFFFEKFCYKLRHDGTCENYTLKSIAGFIGGFILTYIFFMFSVFQLNLTLSTATVFCCILGCILMIGLAFSPKIRCIVLLTLPQFFSQKGRQALLAYAFILAISGPAQNTLNNMGILSESLACGQEQLKQAVRQIIDVIKKPFLAIKEAIKKVVKTVKEIVKKIKEILLTIKRVIMAILRVIKAAFQFLAKIINICNKELGTPFERCTRVFENAIVDCNAKLGPLFNWLCNLTYIVQSVCYLVKFLDLICMIVDFISDSIVGVVIRKVKTFIRHIRTMFYVRIKFSHSFQFHTNTSRTMSEIAHEMVAEIKQRTELLRAIFKFMTSAATLFFLFIIIKVTYYRFRFLTSERFDNKYINKDFRTIDLRRAKLGKETVLPLNDREMEVYVTVSSKKLAKSEKKALSKSVSTLATASVKLAIFMIADYSLFWMLNLIKYYGRFQSKVQAPNMPTVHIAGNGFLADLLKSIVKAFQPIGVQLEIDTVPCLPTPIPPNYDRYVQIATVILLCWVLTLLEPYGLRLRHIVMCYYHPTRAKQRSIWLYNHIMRARNSFLKFARRQLRRKVLGDGSVAKITCKEFLAANFKICRLCLGEGLQQCCLLCGEVFRESDNKKPIKCHTPDCPGIYCEQCFSDLQNLCTVCLSPIEYGDLSDISEEKDSSEEEPKAVKPKQTKKEGWMKWCICSKCCKKCFSDAKEKEHSTKSKPWFGKSDGEDKDSSDEEGKLLKDYDNTDVQEKTDGKDGEMDKTKDSDYYSSDNSTDYSYSYQYDKNYESQPIPLVTPFKDVEKQEVPDYASMSSFRDEPEEVELEGAMLDKATIVTPKRSIGTVISGATFEEIKKGRKVEFSGVSDKSKTCVRKKKKKRKKTGEERPLLAQGSGSCTCSDTDDSSRIQQVHGPVFTSLKSGSSSITQNIDWPSSSSSEEKRESSVVSAIGANTKSDIRHIQSFIPHLNLHNVQQNSTPKDEITTSSSLVSKVKCKHHYLKITQVESAPASATATEAKSDIGHIQNLVPELDLSDVQRISTPMDEIATTSSLDSKIKHSQYFKTIPELDLSSLSSTPRSRKNYVNDIFGNVKYDEVSESPKSTSSSSRLCSSSSDISSLERARENIRLRIRPPIAEAKVDTEVQSTSKTKVDEGVSAKPVNSYKFEQTQRKKVKQYYKAIKSIPCWKTEEKGKPGKFMKFMQKIIPKRKRNPDVLPLYSTDNNKEEVELKSYGSSHDHLSPQSSTSVISALIRQKSAINRNNYTSPEEDEEDRVRGGESGHIRNFKRSLSRCGIEETSSSGTDTVFLTNYANYSKQNTITKEVLAKYFVSLEDLTPTRDCDMPMTTIEPQKSSCRKGNFLIRELPEKDTPLRQNKNECPQSSAVQSIATLSAHNIQTSSSSNLSEAFCSSVLGVPCSIGDFRTNSSTSGGFSCHSGVRRENLCVIPEAEVAEDIDQSDIPTSTENRAPEINLNKEVGHKSQPNLPAKSGISYKISRFCSCESIVNKDGVSQTCPSSILKQSCPCPESAISKSFSDASQQSIFLAETGINTGTMERHISTTDKTVETTEKYPVRDPVKHSTNNKMQQTSDNCISSINDASQTLEFEESSLTTPRSPSSASYCDCQCGDMSHTQCSHSCCKCPPPPPRFEPSGDVDYGAIPRRRCPGYAEKYSKYPPVVCSDYSMRSAHRPVASSRRHYMEFPTDSVYSLGESRYKDHTVTCTSESSRSSPNRPQSRQKTGNIVICSCNGGCRCCIKKRKSPHVPKPSQYRPPVYESSSDSELEDDVADGEESDWYHDSNPNSHDLPYQNSEDYLDLVQELEETLQSRNRNRVRRAMQEFERRSRYNKPLDKPIIDYDQTSESEEPILKRITQLTSEKKRCCAGDMCSCRREPGTKSAQGKRPQPKQRVKIKGYSGACRSPQLPQSEGSKSRWQMDMNSGEWYKVSDKSQRYKGRRRSNTPSPRRACPHDCNCCASKKYDYR